MVKKDLGLARLVADESDRCARFLSDRTGGSFCPPFYAFGWERDGEIFAAILVNQFESYDCHVSVAGSGWTRGMLRQIGQYIFSQLGCIRFTLTTESEGVAKYAERLGGKREGLLRNSYGPGRDAIIIGVLREEYAYLKD